METERACRDCGVMDDLCTYVDTQSGEKLVLCDGCGDADPEYIRMDEMRMCIQCSTYVRKTYAWAEIDPCTGKTVYICDSCYNVQPPARVRVIISMHFMERRTTLDVLEIAHDVYAFRATYHRFDDHVQNEPDIDNFTLLWIRDAFNAMNHVYDDLSVCATETYMDCDICNQ